MLVGVVTAGGPHQSRVGHLLEIGQFARHPAVPPGHPPGQRVVRLDQLRLGDDPRQSRPTRATIRCRATITRRAAIRRRGDAFRAGDPFGEPPVGIDHPELAPVEPVGGVSVLHEHPPAPAQMAEHAGQARPGGSGSDDHQVDRPVGGPQRHLLEQLPGGKTSPTVAIEIGAADLAGQADHLDRGEGHRVRVRRRRAQEHLEPAALSRDRGHRERERDGVARRAAHRRTERTVGRRGPDHRYELLAQEGPLVDQPTHGARPPCPHRASARRIGAHPDRPIPDRGFRSQLGNLSLRFGYPLPARR